MASLRPADSVILGVTGKSEMNHWCEVSFCILDKTERSLSGVGRKGS